MPSPGLALVCSPSGAGLSSLPHWAPQSRPAAPHPFHCPRRATGVDRQTLLALLLLLAPRVRVWFGPAVGRVRVLVRFRSRRRSSILCRLHPGRLAGRERLPACLSLHRRSAQRRPAPTRPSDPALLSSNAPGGHTNALLPYGASAWKPTGDPSAQDRWRSSRRVALALRPQLRRRRRRRRASEAVLVDLDRPDRSSLTVPGESEAPTVHTQTSLHTQTIAPHPNHRDRYRLSSLARPTLA